MAAVYSPKQQKVIRALDREADQRGLTGRRGRTLRLAAFMTGITESGLRNLPYGEGSSVNWRQETAESYPNVNRMNLRGSVGRFFDEAEAAYRPGIKPGTLAQNVQRSAFGSRYAEHRGEALRLLGSTRGGARGGGRGAAGQMQVTQPTLSRGETDQGTGDVVSVLAAALKQRPQVQSQGIQAPEFSAGPAFPGGYQPVQPSPQVVDDSLDEALMALGTLKGAVPGRSTVTPGQVRSTLRAGKLKAGTGRSVLGDGALFDVRKDGWKGARSVGIGLSRIALEAGASQGSEKRSTVRTASGNVSDHYEGNRDSYAWDLMATGGTGDRVARRIARALGVKWQGGSWLNVTKRIEGRLYRFQVGWKVPDHFDHVHLGVDRADIPG